MKLPFQFASSPEYSGQQQSQKISAMLTSAGQHRLLILGIGALLFFPLQFGIKALSIALNPMPFPYAYVASPNCDDRPLGNYVSCIVLHATVEPTTEGTMGIFLTPQRQVSAHFVVGRDGRVVQMVPVEKKAWHAGVSVLDGIPKVNDYSVGIEIVNLNDGKDPYPPEQMQAVAGIIRFIRSRYDVPDSRIVSHAQIGLPSGRKSDPVGLDLDKIKEMARAAAPIVRLNTLRVESPYPPAKSE